MVSLIGRILCATDFSDCADRALMYALSLASTWKAEVSLLHVLEFDPGLNPDYPVHQIYLKELRKEANRNLAALQSRIAEFQVPVDQRMEVGEPSQRIEAVAKESAPDLIVVGTHGRTGLSHVLLGSTAERVVRTAVCPVLSVRVGVAKQNGPPASESVRGIRMQRILVPIDFSDCSLDALEYAAAFARHEGGAIMILHVMEPVAYGLDFTLSHAKEARQQRNELRRRLEELARGLSIGGVKADHVLRGGLPNDSITEYAREHGHDVIIMGTHGRRGLSHILTGSIAGAMLRMAPCPVLTVRSPKFGLERRPVATATDS